MHATPNAAKVLSNVLFAHGWTQAELAVASDIAIPTVSHHINGLRPIRDDHVAAYCTALDRTEQVSLVAAWLRDTLPPGAQEAVLRGPSTVAEDLSAWRPGLDPEQQAMIEWWCSRLAVDRELDHIFRALTRKAGWPEC